MKCSNMVHATKNWGLNTNFSIIDFLIVGSKQPNELPGEGSGMVLPQERSFQNPET